MATLTLDEVGVLATFAASAVVLYAGHDLADHLTGQTDWMAEAKGAPSNGQVAAGASRHQGWGANLAHVGLYHLTLAAAGVLAWWLLPLVWSWPGVVAALVWSASTHAVIDRRWPVRWLLEHTGSEKFAQLSSGGLNGPYLVDQALHHVVVVAAALMLAVIP